MDLVHSKTLKKNRKGPYTEGLAITNWTNNLRFCFFEIDKPIFPEQVSQILGAYYNYCLDIIIHRTGNGLHFISPTLVSLKTWQKFHSDLKHLNPKCPMTTLRIEPNKYPNERTIWFLSECWYNNDYRRDNSIELSNLIFKWFGERFKAQIHTNLKFVRYPLP